MLHDCGAVKRLRRGQGLRPIVSLVLPDNPPALAHRKITWGQKAITQYTLKRKCDTIEVCVADSYQS